MILGKMKQFSFPILPPYIKGAAAALQHSTVDLNSCVQYSTVESQSSVHHSVTVELPTREHCHHVDNIVTRASHQWCQDH